MHMCVSSFKNVSRQRGVEKNAALYRRIYVCVTWIDF